MINLASVLLALLTTHALADEIADPYSAINGAGYGSPPVASPVVAKPPVSGDPCLNPMAQREWDNKCICERQKIKIDWARSQGKSLNSFAWDQIRNKQLVVIGDEHTQLNQDAELNLMARSRSTSGKQCAFFEFSSDFSKDQFLNLLATNVEDPGTNVYRRYFIKIVKGAAGLGLNIFNVDDPKNYLTSDASPTEEAREAHMAHEILQKFRDKKCDHAISLVGKGHIAKQYYGGLPNLTEQLSKGGLKLTRLNPAMAQNPEDISIAGSWNNLGRRQTFTPKESLIFSNSGIASDLITPGVEFPQAAMKYGSFDYTILIPGPWFDKRPR